MEFFTVVCALAFFSVIREGHTCQGRDTEDISGVLTDVRNWKGLAGRLNIRHDAIEANCARDSEEAACQRRNLVTICCNRQKSNNPKNVAECIAKELEQMDHKLQAEELRRLQFEPADLPTTPLRGVEAIKADIKQLKNHFEALEHATEEHLQRANIPVRNVTNVIYSLPTDKKKLHQIFLMIFAKWFETSETISVIFRRLDMHDHWDYLNTDILNHIITEFSLPTQTQLDAYKQMQMQFMEQTTVNEFYEAEGDRPHIKPPPGFVKQITQHEWKSPTYLKEVDDFRMKFAHRYDIRECAVILVSVRGGSVNITMMVPESVIPKVNSTGIEFLKKNGIVYLQLNGTCFYKEKTGGEPSPSAVQPPLNEQSQFSPETATSVSITEETSFEPSMTLTHATGPFFFPVFTSSSITDVIQQNWGGCLAVVEVVVFIFIYVYCTRCRKRRKKPIIVEKPPEQMICPVMKTLMLEPHQTDCCGKHLSAEAATKLQEEDQNCPLCREPCFTSRPDMHFRRQVHELLVFCQHKEEGCEWVGELFNVDHHMKSCHISPAQLSRSAPQSSAQRRRKKKTRYTKQGREKIMLETGSKFALNWSNQKKAPETMRRGAAVVHNTAKIVYVIGAESSTIYSYQLDGEKWNKHSECPYINPGLAIIDKMLTVIGGKNKYFPTKKHQELFSWSQERWEKKFPSMQTPRENPAVIHYDTYVIVMGGDNEERRVELLNVSSHSWSGVTSLPKPLTRITATLCHDKIIAMDNIGTAYEAMISPAVAESSIELSQWMPLPKCPVNYQTLTTLNEQALVVSYKGIFQLQEKEWVRIGNMSVPMDDCIVWVWFDQMVVVGGYTSGTESPPTSTDAVCVAVVE